MKFKTTQKKLVFETFFDFQQLLDRTEVGKNFIDDFNNSIYFLIKGSGKVVEIFIE